MTYLHKRAVIVGKNVIYFFIAPFCTCYVHLPTLWPRLRQDLPEKSPHATFVIERSKVRPSFSSKLAEIQLSTTRYYLSHTSPGLV